jgi:hypothetical protein
MANEKKKLDKHTPFKRLLVEASDDELASAVDYKIRDRYPEVMDFRKLTPEERAIVLVLYATAIIDNGGFEYWLEGKIKGDPHSRLTAEAFNAVGLTRSYEAFQKLLRIFPDEKLPRTFDERMSYFNRFRPKVRGELSRMVWQDGWDGLVSKQVAQFIRDNAEKLKHLK